jgi:hypothetical protein
LNLALGLCKGVNPVESWPLNKNFKSDKGLGIAYYASVDVKTIIRNLIIELRKIFKYKLKNSKEDKFFTPIISGGNDYQSLSSKRKIKTLLNEVIQEKKEIVFFDNIFYEDELLTKEFRSFSKELNSRGYTLFIMPINTPLSLAKSRNDFNTIIVEGSKKSDSNIFSVSVKNKYGIKHKSAFVYQNYGRKCLKIHRKTKRVKLTPEERQRLTISVQQLKVERRLSSVDIAKELDISESLVKKLNCEYETQIAEVASKNQHSTATCKNVNPQQKPDLGKLPYQL